MNALIYLADNAAGEPRIFSSRSWDVKKWESVVTSWPQDIPIVAISFDHHKKRQPFLDQVKLARQRFKCCAGHLNSLLIKPETTKQKLLTEALNSAMVNATELGSFDMIGVTEKELGSSVLDRMEKIARLRTTMDQADVKTPIHIFGALDPLSVCLYYVAGAEVFDGLTWIRYAYHEGQCVYTHNHGALRYGIDVNENQVKSRAMAQNYYYLQNLQRRLREFCSTGKLEKLAPHAKVIEDAWDSLTTRLKRGT